MNKQATAVPKLRFPEFQDAEIWEEKALGQIANYENGKAHEQDIEDTGDFVVVNSKFISSDAEVKKFTNTALCIAQKEDILMVLSDLPNGRAIAKCFFVAADNVYTVNQRVCKITPNKVVSIMLFYSLNRNPYFLAFDDGVKQTNLKKYDVLNCLLLLPKNIKEQQKIADCLSSLDALITTQTQKLQALQQHKKGLMQNLFPAEGKTTPKLRFPEFRKCGEWVYTKLSELLEYEQPTKYIVNNTNYSDNYKTPVLTAGKSFILGYTDEKDNILKNNLPVIIFDDFTTATQFVDFSFKVKSSAMKILKPINNLINIKLVYELMQMIDFNAKEHKRYWISEYQNLQIRLPQPNEQQKIADCLSSLDALITTQTQKLQALQQHKKGLMQQLFPATDEVDI